MKQIIVRHFLIPAFLLLILFCALAHSETCVDKNEIICHTLCQSDNDDLGIIIKGECYCANKRSMTNTPFKIKNGLKGQVVQEARKIYWSWE